MPSPMIYAFGVRQDGRLAAPPVTYPELANMARREEETPLPGSTALARRLVNNIIVWLKKNGLGEWGTYDRRRLVDPAAPGVGWGVVFGASVSQEVRTEIERLAERRQGYPLEDWAKEDSLVAWLAKHGVDSLHRDVTSTLPYYLLLVARPDEISFSDQVELSRLRATGRLDLGDDPLDYRTYIDGLIAREEAPVSPRRVLIAAARHPGDEATRLAASVLAPSLADLTRDALEIGDEVFSLDGVNRVELVAALQPSLLGWGPDLALLAMHGLTFPINHPRQRSEAGALVCTDWAGGLVPNQACLAGDQVGLGLCAPGSILFSLAAYSSGTPQKSEYAKWYNAFHPHQKMEEDLASQPFTAALPRRLLVSKREGTPASALAFIGPVDLSWTSSFWESIQAAAQLELYKVFVYRLLQGETVGMATAALTGRIQDCNEALEGIKDKLGRLKIEFPPNAGRPWIERSHARGMIIHGDPAVRLQPGE